MTTATATQRIARNIGTCKRCRKVLVVTPQPHQVGFAVTRQCECSDKHWATVVCKPVLGTHSAKKCDARCMSAKGNICDCSCSGENHGAGW